MRATIQILLYLPLFSILCSSCSRGPQPLSETTGERVVSLAPNLTEIVCAIGAGNLLVGRTSACDYPPEAVKNVPVVGGFGTPSLDTLIRANPTIVIEVALEDERIGKMIEQLGVRRATIKCATLDDIPSAIITAGALLDRAEAAGLLAETISNRIAQLREEPRGGPTVYVEIWGDPLMTVGRGSFVSDLVSLAGGRNIGDEITDREYFSVSPEWVIARDPEVIICLYMSDARTIGDSVAARTGWSRVSAVQTGRVQGGLESSLALRPGPRVLDGIKMLQDCIHHE